LFSAKANWRREVVAFLFPHDRDTWLAILRIGLGLEVTLQTYWLHADWYYLFTGNGRGMNTRAVVESFLAFESPLIPRLGWLVQFGAALGLSEHTTLFLTWLILLCAGIFLLLGIFPRAAAVIAWFLHLCTAKSGGLLGYGVDNFMTIGLFYLMLSPLPDRFALTRKLWNRSAADPRLLGFFRRILQCHLCLIYFFSGLAKSLGSGWWNGASVWRALIRPPFDLLSPELIASWHVVLPFAGISVCMLEIGYPLFIWLRKTSRLWLALVCLMHLGIGLAMGLHLFALNMIVLNLAAFAPPPPFSRRA
jgi:hypothetical protein